MKQTSARKKTTTTQLVVAGVRSVRLRIKDPDKLTHLICMTQLLKDGDKTKTKTTRQAVSLTSFCFRHEENFKSLFFFQFYQKLFNNGNLSHGSDT